MPKYTYKLEKYGRGLTSYVIYKDGKPFFHSNGYDTITEAILHAKGYLLEKKLFGD